MTRVSTFTQQFSTTSGIYQAQRDIALAAQQSSTQKKAQDLKGYGTDATALVSSRSLLERFSAQKDLITSLESRLDVQDTALGELSAAANEVRLAITEALAIDKGVGLSGRLDAAFRQAFVALNATFGGEFLFNGTDNETSPLTVSTLDELAATAATDDAFADGTQRRRVQLGDQPFIDLGPRAREIATELFDVLRSIRQFEQTPGNAFGYELTDAQRTFLNGALATAKTAETVTARAQSDNGVVQAAAERASLSLESRANAVEKIIADKENVDLAEVATRLAAAQNQLAVSSQVFATISGLTLLDFLR